MSPPRIVPFVVLCACSPESSVEPLGERFDLGPEGLSIASIAGGAPLSVPVRSVNAWGVPVPADPQTVSVDGQPVGVTFDPYGFGEVVLTQPGAALVDGVDVLVLDGATQGFSLPRAHASMGAAIAVAPADGGALVATAEAVWFAGADGRTWPVLRPGTAVAGVVSGHIDRDGVLDAIAWTTDALVVLRGRPDGGFAWSAGVEAPGYEPLGAGIGDTSGDGLPDVVIAWGEGLEGFVEVWNAAGAEEWVPTAPIPLPAVPVAVAVGDNAGTGRSQVTVTLDDGTWTRIGAAQPGTYTVIGPTTDQINLEFEPGAVPVSDGDYNGDGGEELFVADPRVPSMARRVEVWDLVGSRPSTLGLESVGAWLDVEDANADEQAELWLLADAGDLVQLAWTDGLNARRTLATLPDPGPIAAADQTGDGVAEALVAGGSAWRWWPGKTALAEGGNWWAPDAPETGSIEAAAIEPLVTTDLDGSKATAEVAAFVVTGGLTEVLAWRFDPGLDATPTLLGRMSLGTGAAPIDLAACGDMIYALTDGKLWMLNPAIDFIGEADADGQVVACGEGPGGSRVAVLDDGVVTLRDAGLSVTGSENVPGAVAIGLVAGELVSCTTPGCSVTGWGPDGLGEVAVSTDADGTIVDDTYLPGTGALATGDVDGDGHDDLVAADTGALVVHRSAGDGFGPTEAWHLGSAEARVILADVTGDGAAEPLWIDTDGAIVWPVGTSP